MQVKNEGSRAVETKYECNKKNKSLLCNKVEDPSSIIESYESIAANIIKNAKLKAEEIQKNALQEIMIKEKETYEKAYEEGKTIGYEHGYNESYEKGMEKCRIEEEAILGNAHEVLCQCEEYYKKYLMEKEVEIKETVITICEEILKKEVDRNDGLNSIIFNVLSEIKKAKKIILRCNERYYESIAASLETWKNELTYRAEMFLIRDERVQDGEAVIEKDDGITRIDINYSLDKVREVILYEE